MGEGNGWMGYQKLNKIIMLSEIFKEEGESIYSFKSGDIIIRVKSAMITDFKTNENLGIEMQVIQGIDNSFRETPVRFVGIKNNLIYLQSLKPIGLSDKLHIYKCRLEMYENDWKLFEVPDGLTIEDCI